jgi:hypothetical protein
MARRDLIAQIALAHAGASATLKTDVYRHVVVRPADFCPPKLRYFDNNPVLETSALFVLGCLRLAGCTEPECTASHLPENGPVRNAMVDIQQLGRRFGAWVTSSPPVPIMRKGDIWIVADAVGGAAHTGICTSEAGQADDGSWSVATAEGGQPDGKGTTAIGTFTRSWGREGARLKLGDRYLIGYVSAERLPIPDTNDQTVNPVP